MTPFATGRQSSAGQRAARIAVDLLGGDHAPAVVVDGALEALAADPGLSVTLVGPPPDLESVTVPPSLRTRLTFVASSSKGSFGGSSKGRALRGAIRGRSAYEPAVEVAVRAALAGEVDAVVSAGSTGATVTAAVRGAGRTAGVASPALAVVVPAATGPVVLLDVGAVPKRDARLLASHAALGASYAAVFLDLPQPRVGILSIGEEADKGDAVVRQVSSELAGAALPAGARFVGNVEGHQVPLGGPADVVVTDGFTGNAVLKAIEGTVSLVGANISRTAAPRAALLLGVPVTVVVCHGAATAADLASGVALAARAVRRDVIGRIAADSADRTEPVAVSAEEEVRR